MKSVINGETIQLVNGYYEKKGSEITKYYFAGASRVAMRKYTVPQSMTVEYMLGDHLGSTSITTDTSGTKVSEMRYKPWGEVRYHWIKPDLSTTPAYKLPVYTFTGQRSYMDDPSTTGVEGFGLLDYNARMYDPTIGRFIQADSIVPGGVQGLDRYAYVNNSPVMYIDPSGHDPSNNNCDYAGDCDESGTEDNFTCNGHDFNDYAQELCDDYIELRDEEGWWNNYGEGMFTLWDFINILLSMEFPGLDIPDKVLLELVVRNMYKTCAENHLQCDASNPYDVLRYLALRNIKYKWSGQERDYSPEAMERNKGFVGDYWSSTNFASGFKHGNSEWATGCDSNGPCEWANRDVRDLLKADKTVHLSDNQIYGNFSTAHGLATKNPFSTDINSFYWVKGGGKTNYFFIITGPQIGCVYYGYC